MRYLRWFGYSVAVVLLAGAAFTIGVVGTLLCVQFVLN